MYERIGLIAGPLAAAASSYFSMYVVSYAWRRETATSVFHSTILPALLFVVELTCVIICAVARSSKNPPWMRLVSVLFSMAIAIAFAVLVFALGALRAVGGGRGDGSASWVYFALIPVLSWTGLQLVITAFYAICHEFGTSQRTHQNN